MDRLEYWLECIDGIVEACGLTMTVGQADAMAKLIADAHGRFGRLQLECNTMKTLRDLVESGLRAGGFDGLCNDFANCACWADDLFPCGGPSGECMAGHACPCNGNCDSPPCNGHIYTDLEDLERAKRGGAERLEGEK